MQYPVPRRQYPAHNRNAGYWELSTGYFYLWMRPANYRVYRAPPVVDRVERAPSPAAFDFGCFYTIGAVRELMEIKLTETEVRVLGSLIEKDITTPEYYPLSLNALVNACNQKTNRDPVMQLDEDAVRDALDGLQQQRMAGPARGADSRVTKYEQRLQEVFNFTRAETAILCVLLLRGPQTPGELRGRADACTASKRWRMCNRRCRN